MRNISWTKKTARSNFKKIAETLEFYKSGFKNKIIVDSMKKSGYFSM